LVVRQSLAVRQLPWQGSYCLEDSNCLAKAVVFKAKAVVFKAKAVVFKAKAATALGLFSRPRTVLQQLLGCKMLLKARHKT
jgi:hypothetical protein